MTPQPGGRPYQPPAGYPSQAPIRLRDPLPAQSTAFATRNDGSSWWLPVVLGVLAVVVVVVVILLIFAQGSDGGGSTDTTTPSINVPPTSTQRLPTNIPTVSR